VAAKLAASQEGLTSMELVLQTFDVIHTVSVTFSSVRTAGGPTGIRTVNLLSTYLEHYLVDVGVIESVVK
jgi:hypothetical protein